MSSTTVQSTETFSTEDRNKIVDELIQAANSLHELETSENVQKKIDTVYEAIKEVFKSIHSKYPTTLTMSPSFSLLTAALSCRCVDKNQPSEERVQVLTILSDEIFHLMNELIEQIGKNDTKI